MSPAILDPLAFPAAIGLLGLAGGAALAQLAGPLSCAWPAKGRAMLRRLNAVKLYRRPGAVRTAVGGAALAAVLAGGGLAAYAAAPANLEPLAPAVSAPRLAVARLAVVTSMRADRPGLAAPTPAAPTPPAVLAAAEAPIAQAPAVQPQVLQPQSNPLLNPQTPRLAVLIRGDDSNYAQVRADILNNLLPPQMAAMPASPTLVGPLSVYAPAGASSQAVIAQAFADPRGTWEGGDLDPQGGRTFTRTSTSVASPVAFGSSAAVLTIFYPLRPPSVTAEAANAARMPPGQAAPAP